MVLKQLEFKPDPTKDELDFHDLQELDTVNQELFKMATRRSRTLELLEEYAQLSDNFFIQKNQRETRGYVVGAAGGILTTIGGIVTIATGGLAAPAVLTGLAVSGTAAGIGGAGFNIWSSHNASKRESDLKESLKTALAEDVEERQKLEDVIERVNLRMEDIDLYYNGVKMFSYAAHCIGNLKGSDSLMDLMQIILTQILPSLLSTYLPSGSTYFIAQLLYEIKAVGAATSYFTKGIAEEAAEKATKEIVDGFSKRYVNKIAKKAAETALKEAATETAGTVVKEVAGETAKETARSAAKVAAQAAAKRSAETILKESGGEVAEAVVKASAKKAGKQAAEQIAKISAQEAAEEAAKGAMKTAAKMTGAVTVGFGVLAVGWDGYNALQSIKRVKNSKSELGEELRLLIKKLQPSI